MKLQLRLVWFFVLLYLPLNIVEGRVELTVLNQKESLMPGGVYTLFIRVENDGEAVELSQLEVIVPANWVLVTKTLPTDLPKNGEGKILITFSTPEEEMAGTFDFSILIYGLEGLLGKRDLKFSINEVHDLALQVIEKPEQINGPGNFQCRFLISNTGNMQEEIKLISRAGKFEGKTLLLQPWSSESITLDCNVADDMLRAATLIVDLQAQIKSPDTTYSMNIPIPYFPTKTLKVDKYQRFPIAISGTFVNFSGGKETTSSARFHIQGQGFLDRRQKLLLGLIASGPNQFQQARFGQYDQYSLNLAYKSFGELHLGDLGVSLSPLTEYSRFGRGVSYKQNLGPVEVSGFHIKPRFFPDSDRMYGMKGSVQLTKNLDIQGNWLNKNFVSDDGKPEAVVQSIETNYSGRNVSFAVEGAQSKFRNIVDYATQAQFDYSGLNLQINGNFLYAGNDFTGYYNNSLFGSVSARYAFTDKFSASISGSQNESNPQQDTLSITVLPKYTYYSSGLHYRRNTSETFSLQMLLSRKKDRLEPVDYNFYDRLAQFSYYRRKDLSELNIEGSFGKTRNFLISAENKQEGNSFRTNLFYGYQAGSNFRLGAHVEFFNTNKFSDQKTNQQLLFYGARVNYRKSDQFFLQFNYRSNFPLDELFQPRSFIDGEVSYRWLQGNNISASAGYSIFPGTKDLKQFFLSANYTHTLNIPIRKVLNLGALKGRLIAKSSEKIGGIHLSIAGQEIVTDLSGNFEFNDLPLGQNFLHISPSSLNMNEVPKSHSPIPVDIAAQETTEVEIEILTCGAVSGFVNFKEGQTTQSEAFVKERPKIFLKIQSETSTFYTSTSVDGRFQFLGLRPGSWKLSVLESGWDSNFQMDSREREISLSSGQAIELEFELSPKRRQLKFSDKTIKIQSKNE